MKAKICLLVILLFCLGNIGYSQTGIGVYSVHDGGFENHTTTLVGGSTTNAALSTSLWTASTTANVTRTLTNTGGRSGPKYVTLGSTNGTAKSFYTPQIAGSFAASTTYQVQFWYKTASTTALDASTVDIYVNNTTATQAPPIGTVKSVAAGLTTNVSTWTKVAVSITTSATPAAGNFGVAGLTIDAATAGYAADIDDFVVYQASSADTSAPNSPGTVTATAASSSTATVSWGAASGGVDGGGYVVVRFATTAPSASDDPNQNGIYKFNNAIGAGFVRYIGTSTSFTDTSLTPGVDYYYKVYTVDKAFNYSSETTTSSPVQALATTYYYKGSGALTDVTNWGLNTDGTGTNPSNFTDVAQVFEIRNTTAVALDGSWTVGTDPANGTKVRLGNTDQAAITLTLNSGASILPAGTGNLDVMAPPSGKQTVIYKGTTAISFGNIFDTNLEVVYDGVTISSTTTKSFGTITIKNGANVTFTATPVIKNMSIDATSTLVAPTAATAYITIPSGGAVTINGTVKVPKLTGFVSSNVVTAGSTFGDLQFIGTENLTLGSNSTVEYARDATGAQTVTARTDYKNLTLSGTAPKSFAGATTVAGSLTINQTGSSLVSLAADTTVNGTLVFTNGKIDAGSNTLILGSAATISGAGSSTGWVIGNLRKTTTSGSSPSFTYPIGDANYYTPLALTFASNTTANGTLTARTTAGDHAQIATSGIIAANSINRTWTLTNSNLAGFSSYNAAFTYATQDNDSGALPQFFAARLYAGSSWSNLTTSGTPTSTSFTASAVTSFGDFAIGQVCINPTAGGVVSGTQSICENGIPSSFSSTSAASGFVGNVEYKWQSSTNNSTFTDISGATSSTYSAAAGLTVTTYYKRLARVDCKTDWTGAAESNTITVTVNSIVTPTFTQVSTICSGASLSALPTTSNNAVTGTWSPAVNNMATTSYTFTPTAGLCASTANMSITVNPSVTYYRDNDTDGYGDAATSSSSCTGAPSGYVTNATDCNDSNASINPSATEVFDGIDNNCNGQTDEGVTPNVPTASAQVLVTGATVSQLVASGSTIAGYSAPAFNWYLSATGGSSLSASTVLTTNTYYVSQIINGVESGRTAVAVTIIPSNPFIAASFCGNVLSNIETTIYSSLVSGGTKYRFMITSPSSASVVYESTTNGFNFLQLSSNNSFNTTYGVKCAVFINGAWSAYGNSCSITTPAVPASSKIIDAQCGTTLSSADNTLYCGQSYGAQGYRFEVSSGGTTRTIDRSVNYMQLSSLSGGVNFGTTYSVRVAVLYGATYGAYGAACNITTPSLPSQTKVNTTQCGSTLASKWKVLYCGAVAGATAYNFEWTNGGTTLTYTSSVPNMQLGNYTGWALNTTYSVRVAIQYGGTWQTYGTACNITTPATFARHNAMDADALSVKAVPNPYETEFVLMTQGGNQNPIQVTVYDMLGKQVDQFSVEANELENRSLGNGYTSGIYNVVIAQGDDQQVVRLIKK